MDIQSSHPLTQKLGLQNPQPFRRTTRTKLAAYLLTLIAALPPCFGQCEDEGIEGALRCSDLIVLGRVIETLPEGRRAGSGGIIHTVHILKVEEYYLGVGPEKIELLTPGGQWTDSEGRKLYLSIATSGGSEWRGALVGEEMVAFLQRDGNGYIFTNRCGGKLLVQKDPESGTRQVVIRFHKKEYLRGTALQQYEEAEKRMHSPKQEEAAEATRKLYGAFSEVISVSQVSGRVKLALIGEGGPKSANTICY